MGNKQRSALEFAVLDWLTLRGGQWFSAADLLKSNTFDSLPWPPGQKRFSAMRDLLNNLAHSGLIASRRAAAYQHLEYAVLY